MTTLAALLRAPSGDWRDRAECRRLGLSPDLFVPRSGPPGEAAVRACQVCPVAAECRAARGDSYGLWGGEFRPLTGAYQHTRRQNTCIVCGGRFEAMGGGYRYCPASACQRERRRRTRGVA